jgi:signal transduction histidine kinase
MITEKKHSELLVDLITYDIGNHHQIVGTSLEIINLNLDKMLNKKDFSSIAEQKENLNKLKKYCNSAQDALSRSKYLVENIRRLEKMYREKDVRLKQVDVLDAIKNALSLVQQNAYLLNKTIDLKIQNQTSQKTSVKIAADDFLEDIFVNFFSNSVRYTADSYVRIELVISDCVIGQSDYYVISIADHSKGIHDNYNQLALQRYY